MDNLKKAYETTLCLSEIEDIIECLFIYNVTIIDLIEVAKKEESFELVTLLVQTHREMRKNENKI